jgi:hypothetical protein
MKLLDIVRPINHQKKRELEAQLEEEKLRLKQATESAAKKVRDVAMDRRWFREHPLETTLLIALGGYCVARWAAQRREDRLQLSE